MTNHRDVVEHVKALLERANVPLQGSCGAFRILYTVAATLNAADPARRWGFLLKTGGNRAVPQPDGACLSGEETSAPGYATDYLIDQTTGFGYDVLGDGGGANTPQWPDEPETDPALVARNRANFREPPAWTFLPPIDVPPIDVPPDTPPADPAPTADEVATAIRALARVLQTVLAALTTLESMQVLRQADLTGRVDDLEARIFGTKAADGLTLTGSIFAVPLTLKPPRPK